MSTPDVRADKIATARESAAIGRYQRPEVVQVIVERLLEQFGL